MRARLVVGLMLALWAALWFALPFVAYNRTL